MHKHLKLISLFLRLSDGDEIRTGPAAINLIICDSLIGKSEMAGRLCKGRVDNWVFDDDLAHKVTIPLPSTLSARDATLLEK